MIIVFLCVANSARSQMAEGLARATAPWDVTVYSAGSAPTAVNPHAIAALAERGLDISHHRSKGLEEVPIGDAQLIIVLCAEESCPVTPPHVRRLSWAMPDPAAASGDEAAIMNAFRTARGQIERNLTALWAELEDHCPK